MSKIKPITLYSGEPRSIKGIGDHRVIDDGSIAVVDGRGNKLPGALAQSRQLITFPEYKFVVVARDRKEKSLRRSYDRASKLFSRDIFGMRSVELGEEEVRRNKRNGEFRGRMGTGIARSGTVLIWPQRYHFLIRQPAKALNHYMGQGFLSFNDKLGYDFRQVFSCGAQVFPEYMSWNIRHHSVDATTAPGYFHFDTGYKVKSKEHYSEETRRSYEDLPRNFAKSALRKPLFPPLSGDIAMTMSLEGGGTLVADCSEQEYEDYCARRAAGQFRPGWDFENLDRDVYQACDGDLLIARVEGWPNLPSSGRKRLPGLHASPLFNQYGNPGHHGRIMGICNSEVSYMAPSVYKMMGETYPPDLPENLRHLC